MTKGRGAQCAHPNRARVNWAVLGAVCCSAACGTTGDRYLGTLSATAGSDVASEDAATPGNATPSDAGPSSMPAPPEPDAGSGTTPTPPHEAGTAQLDGSPVPAGSCATLPLPAQRFDLSGTGTEIVDQSGGPSGRLLGGASLDGSGRVELDGDDDYIDLPNDLLASKRSATIALWVSLLDGPAYWRVFDFGRGSEGEDPSEFAVGTFYVALTTETGLDPSGVALLVGHGGASSEDRALTSLRVDGSVTAVFAVLDGEAMQIRLYLDGARVAEAPMTSPLSELADVNNWLGRSQYTADPYYPGTYAELRFYSGALSDCEVSALAALGPDVVR